LFAYLLGVPKGAVKLDATDTVGPINDISAAILTHVTRV